MFENNPVKTFIPDTNVLIHDPEAILSFGENNIVISIVVIEELDKLKRGEGEIPYSARRAVKLIDSFRINGNNLAKGVRLPGGGILRIDVDTKKSKKLKERKNDNLIIELAFRLKESINGNGRVVLITKDAAVRIKADALGVAVEDYNKDKTTIFKEYGNVLKEQDYTNGILSVRYQATGNKIYKIYGVDKSELVRRSRNVMGIHPKNIEQECAIDALSDPRITSIALTGIAGTGKTLLALAVGIFQTTKTDPLYDQVMVARPIVALGNDIGFLPGDIKEKMWPWMRPIYDNLDVLVGTSSERVENKSGNYKSSDYLVESGVVHIEPLTYIRGRSLPRRFLIIDEAQNLRPTDAKTIITRCGEGTKVVFTGDMEQIDHPFLDSQSNGIAHLIKGFINKPDFCYLNLVQSARSKLAEEAAMLL